VKLQGHRRRGILVGHNFDVCTSAALRRGLKGLIEFSACAYTRGNPVVASKRLGQVGVVPLSKIVVLDVGGLAEQPFNQIARIVKDEDDGFQPATAELTDLLSCQLMGAFTCNQHNATVGRRDCCSKGRRGRVCDSTPLRRMWQESLASSNALEYEARLPGGTDRGYRWYQTRAVPVRDKRGKIVKWYGVINDIEDRKRAEQLHADLAHITRVNTMMELTASLAHNIKQPIGAAVTNAEACARLLDRDQPDVSEAREAALEMARDARHAGQIIDRVRSLYRKDSSHLDIVDVNEIIEEMVLLLRVESHRYVVSLRADLADELPKITADRVQLQQVFMNLMLNGIEAMRENGGELIIKSQLREDGQLRLSVADSGVGLPPEKAGQIFNAFFTTKAQGTGLGLAITRSIVESHGGRVWAAANPERGTTFHFTLPIGTAVSA
jgi:signal transduction histidine kinase